MKKMGKRTWLYLLVALFTGLVLWTLWGNTALEVTEYVISSEEIPQGFDGFRIAQISDLHNAQFGDQNAVLIERLSRTKPDVIVLTGDFIDSRNTDIEISLDFAREIIKIAPVYYVSGNHESRVPEYKDLKIGLLDAGVIVLENQKKQIVRGTDSITIMGIDDPSFGNDYLFDDPASVAHNAIHSIQDRNDGYTILLSHRPELFDLYAACQIDLVFSGHAHGGQFRLPFVGGLVAPNQGLFPVYDAGVFADKNTTMVVSRGVGNSIIPIRFNNRPEIVVVELKTT